ncbi:MAG: hypothetical protein ABMA15_13055 [Vicinamibacterales bacterium]
MPIGLARCGADGHYYAWFRSLQALQVVVLVILFVRMLRIDGSADRAALPVALAVLVGLHTFAGTVSEGFPINTFLTILLCCTAAATLGQARPRVVNDVAAVALLAFAMLTVETGLLVWVIFVVGYVVGDRGLSRGGLVAVTACFAGYFVLRFGVAAGTAPGLDERSSGFGFSTYSPAQLGQMFESPLWFYAYNVVSAMCCVLFGEPRGGVWRFVEGLTTGHVEPWRLVSVVTSTGTSILIARYALQRFTRWKRGEIDAPDRLVILFLALLPANALFTYAYLKDVILSPVGVFYAGAAYVAFRSTATELGTARIEIAPGARWRGWGRRVVLSIAVFVLACG